MDNNLNVTNGDPRGYVEGSIELYNEMIDRAKELVFTLHDKYNGTHLFDDCLAELNCLETIIAHSYDITKMKETLVCIAYPVQAAFMLGYEKGLQQCEQSSVDHEPLPPTL